METYKEILTNLGYKLNDRGSEWRCKPIYRDSDNPSSLKINKKNGKWSDFSANIGGKFEDLIKLTLGLKTQKELDSWLKNKDFSIVQKTEEKPKIKHVKYYEESILSRLIPDYTYWNKRGISTETLKLFRGGGVAHSGKLYRRYVFPIRDKDNKIIGFSGRITLDKYVNANTPKWKHIGLKNEFVYPWWVAEHCIREKREIILVESIGDVLSLNEVGICNCLCLFGVSISSKLISYIAGMNPNRIIIATNNDSDENDNVGQNRALDIHKKLCKFFDEPKVIIAHPSSKDFNEMLMKGDDIKKWYGDIL